MSQVCDHTSVGAIARDDNGRILLIERAKFPFGIAPPSGHCDGLSYPMACLKEFEEETGLKIKPSASPRPVLIRYPFKKFKCRRPQGDYHIWQIFEVQWKGECKASEQEVKSISWYSAKEIQKLMDKTRDYLRRYKLAEQAEDQTLVGAIQNALDEEWEKNPGLEPVWYDFFNEVPDLIKMINLKAG